jgi:hypothetical protein
MKKAFLSRREAMERIAAIAGLAAGLGSASAKRLFAKTAQVNFDKLSKVKAVADEIKALKVLLIPTREVYFGEFGRNPIIATEEARDITELGGCSDFLSPRRISVQFGSCGSNTCSGQICAELTSCPKNACEGQECPKLSRGMATSPLSSATLERFSSDPFVRALFQEFHVETADQLSRQLINIVRQRR